MGGLVWSLCDGTAELGSSRSGGVGFSVESNAWDGRRTSSTTLTTAIQAGIT